MVIEAVTLEADLTCPSCGFIKTETMPTNACQYLYQCKNCHEVLRPQDNDCCVFCSYADVPCPPMQQQNACC